MNSENRFPKTILAGVVVIGVLVEYFAFYPGGPNSDQATSTDKVITTNCDDYDANPTNSEFTPDYQKVRNQADISYHGSDKEGKDGPMAKLGPDVATLYHEYQAFKCNEPKPTFEPQVYATYEASDDTTGPMRGESIVGDISASETATVERLASDLKNIGIEVTAGPIEGIDSNIVSVKIPIDKLPEVAQLDSVRSLTPARATTNDSGGNVIDSD